MSIVAMITTSGSSTPFLGVRQVVQGKRNNDVE